MVKQKREKRVGGWKEHAALPDLNVKSVIAKIDTGATLASIDASDIKIVTRDKALYPVKVFQVSYLISFRLCEKAYRWINDPSST
jgi:hypothetical protein